MTESPEFGPAPGTNATSAENWPSSPTDTAVTHPSTWPTETGRRVL